MAKDKYSAVWLSYSSISDFLVCKRAYFLKNVYKDPERRRKIKVMAPALALGSAVHETLESLSSLPKDARFSRPLPDRFDEVWQKYRGEKGGFFSEAEERRYRERGREMIARVVRHPGPIAEFTLKMKQELPYFWISEEDNIILCGRLDWLRYLPESDSVEIIDFKTSSYKEDEKSLQLPIYVLLATHCQNRPVSGVAYWYLGLSDRPEPRPLPDAEPALIEVLRIGQKIKAARAVGAFDCDSGASGCRACRPYEEVLAGRARLVGEDEFGALTYVLPAQESEDTILTDFEIL